MEISIEKNLGNRKLQLLEYFRNRSAESLQDIKDLYGISQFKERASAINRKVIETKNQLVSTTTLF